MFSTTSDSTSCGTGDIECVNSVVNVVKTTMATISLILSSTFIVYALVHTLMTVRWDILFRNLSGDSPRTRVRKFFNFRHYNNRIVLVNNPILRLLFFLQLSCAIELTQFYIETFRWNKVPFLCALQSIMVTFFGISKACWSICIAVWLFWIIVLKKRNFLILEIISHIFGWAVPVIVTLIPAVTGTMGDAGGYCWIKGDTTLDNIVRFAAYYIPMWLCIGTVGVIYACTLISVLLTQIRAARHIGKRGRSQIFQNSIKTYTILFTLPLIFLVTWIFPTYLSIHGWIFGERPTVFQILHSLSSPTQGMYNTLAYTVAVLLGTRPFRKLLSHCLNISFTKRKREAKSREQKYELGNVDNVEENGGGGGSGATEDIAIEVSSETQDDVQSARQTSEKHSSADDDQSHDDYYADGEYRPGPSLFDLEQQQAQQQQQQQQQQQSKPMPS